ncbi:MAG: HAD-IG family 5'-nucleotidase [Polyangia bacterium]
MSAEVPVDPPPPASESPEHIRLLEALGESTPPLEPPRTRRIFVNRNLPMDQIEVIGFDMDYTLALYNQPRLEALSAKCTLGKMIERRGYPAELLSLPYEPDRAIRGLVVDREAGNVLKMDRYGYVGRGFHGTRPLPKEERRRLYREQVLRLVSERYAWIDTLFALPEAVLYAQAVDFYDRDPQFLALDSRAQSERYSQLWADIRESIDEAHRDETIKSIIKASLGDYIEYDPELPATLHRFRSAGKRLFLLTNSGYDYTTHVMSYLLDRRMPGYSSWRSYFDVIVVDGRKPSFFTDNAPLLELDEKGRVRGPVAAGAQPVRGRIYQGGNIRALDQLLGMRGDRVLYVGDHIYGDMYRAKRSSVWRTAMIIQELEQELDLHARVEGKLQGLEVLERRRIRIDGELRYQQLLVRRLAQLVEEHPESTKDGARDGAKDGVHGQTLRAARAELRRRTEALRAASRRIDDDIDQLELDIEHTFNPFWGPLFKAGAENSRFGEQVEDYACIYTGRVSNFLSYSPFQYFRSPRDHLPHERVY